MKISILTPNLSHNCLGRAYILAKMLKDSYDVEIIGPILGKGIWKPLNRINDIRIKYIDFKGSYSFPKLVKLYRIIDGDIIYANKPLFTSFGLGLIKSLMTKKPLILDIDDWELGFKKKYSNFSFKKRLKYFMFSSTFGLLKNNSYWNILILQKLVKYANKITVSNRFLHNIFGGVIIWHAKDEKELDPRKFSSIIFRKKYNIKKSDKVIMFLGSPKPHKGLEDLIKAVGSLKDKKIVLIIVGIDKGKYCQSIVEMAEKEIPGKIRLFGLQPLYTIPEFLITSDIVVIPQKIDYAGMGQVPSKIFDAMAMERPIITTGISDLPEILNDCGIIINDPDPDKLAEAIDYLLSHPEESRNLGIKARKRIIEVYSWNKAKAKLGSVMQNIGII